MAEETIFKKGQTISKVPSSKETLSESEPVAKLRSFRDYNVIEELPAIGGEADIYLVERERERFILKLYRKGVVPKREVLEKIKEISEKNSEYLRKSIEYGYDEDTKKWYEIMEYIEYGTLEDLLSERKLSQKEIHYFIEHTNETLHILHEEGIIHRDLKPSNILVKNKDPLKFVLSDFGISSLLEEGMSKIYSGFKGTSVYTAPETFSGIMGKEVDYWSLGIIVYKILFGNPPLHGMNDNIIMHTLITQNIEIPEESLSEEYIYLLKGLFTRLPKKRWGYNEVKRWLSGDKSIPIYYETESMAKGFEYRGKMYHSLDKLFAAFISSKDNFLRAQKHIERKNIIKWLESNKKRDKAIEIEEDIKDLPPDEAIVKLFYKYNEDSRFSLFDTPITPGYIGNLLKASIDGSLSGKEKDIYELLENGKLEKYYEIYYQVVKPKDKSTGFLLKNYTKIVGTNRKKEKVSLDTLTRKTLFLFLIHFVLKKKIYEEEYYTPEFLFKIDILSKVVNPSYLFDLIDVARMYPEIVLKKEEVERYILPEPFKNIHSLSPSGYKEFIRRYVNKELLAKKDIIDFSRLKRDYVVPKDLNEYENLEGLSLQKYEDLKKFLERLIGKTEFSKYIIPQALLNKLLGNIRNYIWFYDKFYKIDFLLTKEELNAMSAQTILPIECRNIENLSEKEYIECVKFVKKGVFIQSETLRKLKDFFLPTEIDDLVGQVDKLNLLEYRKLYDFLQKEDPSTFITKKELKNYLLPVELKKPLISYSDWKMLASMYKKGDLIKKQDLKKYAIPSNYNLSNLDRNSYASLKKEIERGNLTLRYIAVWNAVLGFLGKVGMGIFNFIKAIFSIIWANRKNIFRVISIIFQIALVILVILFIISFVIVVSKLILTTVIPVIIILLIIGFVMGLFNRS